MRVTRREFLVAAGGAAAVLALRPMRGRAAAERRALVGGSLEPRTRATLDDELTKLVRSRALALDDAWVLMHAVLPLGVDAAHEGKPVLDFVSERWLESVSRGGKAYPAFPLGVEAHPNHFLEIMLAVGVPADRVFAAKIGRVSRADLTAGAKALFTPAIAGSELSWTVSVFTADMAPDADRFENADGRTFSVASIVEAAAQAAEAGYADTVAAMRGTKPYGRSTLQTYACNGTHVLYGLLDALRHGYTTRGLAERTTVLVQASIFRLGAETHLIDTVLGAGQGELAALNADAAKLQFLGHSLENLGFADRHGLYHPTAAERETIAAAERELAAGVHRIATVYDLDALARQVPRAYAVLLGDACHALHAMRDTA